MRFASDEHGAFALLEREMVGTPAGLRALAGALESLEKALGPSRLVVTHEGCTVPEAVRLTKLAMSDREGRVLSFEDAPGLVEALEAEGARVWKIAGAEGSVFASAVPPRAATRLVPLSKHADFPVAARKPKEVRFLRKDEGGIETPEKQIVYGIVLEPEVVDSQGDIYSAAEIEGACHRYLEDFQNIGHMHATLINQSAVTVESYIAPADFSMGGQTVKAGTWVMAVHVLNDALWKQIKDGDLTGFSIGGWAQRVPVQ